MEETTARKAAKWWADQLRGHAKLDNGDPSPTGGIAMARGMMLQRSEADHRDTASIQKFEDELTKLILEEPPAWGFGVDYHPDRFLRKAIERAGINVGMASLPWKTTMVIKEDVVKVACGYGASMEEL